MKPSTWFETLEGKEVGQFLLQGYVGHGKIGYVYKALSKDVRDWVVAVKIIPGSPRRGWENELRKVSRLSTIPRVVHLHHLDVGRITHDRRTEIFQYTVWDYIAPGRNLFRYLKERESCTASFLLAVVEQVLRVLHACHTKGVRHGDLHPGNVLIGEEDPADLDSSLEPREPVYVSDFGYGTTGGRKKPKDDYVGLAQIVNVLLEKAEWERGTVTDRRMLGEIRNLAGKLLREGAQTERRSAREILETIYQRKRQSQALAASPAAFETSHQSSSTGVGREVMKVGQFQVSEMLGDDWRWWKKLFVSSVPARSRILEPDIATVVTGPRGCGKTMLFRRLSERLMVECGPVDGLPDAATFAGFYLNANDIADAFADFPATPTAVDNGRLICYANLCILADFLAVQGARHAKSNEELAPELYSGLKAWLADGPGPLRLVAGENLLERLRSIVETIKWRFPTTAGEPESPGYAEMSQHVWLRRFFADARRWCAWMASKAVFIFVDDCSTPRVSISMQRVLNRLFLQRTSEFICKVATESATTFVAEDSSGKILQDGDDYQLIDMAEESLFMTDEERARFLNEVFERRLSLDARVDGDSRSLPALLGHSGKGKTEFARLLRQDVEGEEVRQAAKVAGVSRRRGATRPKALYHGWDMFTGLWSGDTRIMIQLVQDLVEESCGEAEGEPARRVTPETQDRVFRNRGGQWLEAQRRNEPTDPEAVERELVGFRNREPAFDWTGGSYGGHLKAVVEAFVVSARVLLLGPVYEIQEGSTVREVPRMAFRLEIIDEFRVSGLAAEIYKDLIRYGLFMRDARGKSVRGAMVPRLYLRRFLLPYCTLSLSKRDSVPLRCAEFVKLLVTPDVFRAGLPTPGRRQVGGGPSQLDMFGVPVTPEAVYDDLEGHSESGDA